MQTAKLLAEAIDVARRLDYTVREEYLEGAGGGHCNFGGKKWLLLDVTQSVAEQLTDVVDALRDEPGVWQRSVSAELGQMLQGRKAA
jgi:hypothetical protein